MTVSTSGIVPHIDKLAADCNVALAVSLHASNNDLRDQIVPINKLHPIAELLDACWRYAAERANRFITFEYVMLKGVNDSIQQANELAALLKGKPAKINLIPFNPFRELVLSVLANRQFNIFKAPARSRFSCDDA